MTQENNIHPGLHVRKSVLPEGITVTEAADMMGVGRPALSNFLNGKAMLSQNMATRLEKAFGADKSELLRVQQDYKTFLNKDTEPAIAVRSYAPSFLNIKASHIDSWGNEMDARSLLPVLLRRLVNSTCDAITHSDFPAYDNSQNRGWDGQVESESAIPWVPVGISGWELSCQKNPTSKANKDYSARTKSVPKTDREKTTFIFMTPRNWNQKETWIAEKRQKNEWKDVRAYDASDLEQWLELSIPGQVWLAEKLGLPQEDCQTLDDYWTFWAKTADPAISKKIFDDAVSDYRDTILRWYQKPPAKKPLVVTAASKDEALAFIACAADSIEELGRFSQKAVLVSNGDTVKKLAAISTEFIPVAHTDSAQRELVALSNKRHSIVVAEKGLNSIEPDIVLALPSHESWRNALCDMGFNDAEREVHANRSGRSRTILRRQLAALPEFRKPAWATSNERIRIMIPLVLAGAWQSTQDADRQILELLADSGYTDIERNVGELENINDAPIWREGDYYGVVSQLDCFHAVSDQVTKEDLDKFFLVAEYVLSEDDPALDLDREERWLANVYDKVRGHSQAIRGSLCDTLIILSVHSGGLFGNRLGSNIKSRVAGLVRTLLRDKSSREWQSQQKDLSRYAEAAPDEFLNIVEAELTSQDPAFASLFEPVIAEGLFARCERTGMIWALELLAWNPSRLSRVAKVLARLCRYELNDNWAHKPAGSLKDIFLSWLPHTRATVAQRVEVLELLCRDYPDVGWSICMSEVKTAEGLRAAKGTFGTVRPRWRGDACGAGQGVTDHERSEFLKKCKELVLSRQTHTQASLRDLIDWFAATGSIQQEAVTDRIKTWLDSSPPHKDILELREHVRIKTMTTRGRKRNKDVHTHADGKKIYDLLEPQDALLKHRWLFADHWVKHAPEELEKGALNHKEREEKISGQRVSALKDVLKAHGPQGIIELCLTGQAGFVIGRHLALNIMDGDELQDYIGRCLSFEAEEVNHRIDHCLAGILHQLGGSNGQITLKTLLKQFENKQERIDDIIRLFINAPVERSTWDLLQTQQQSIQETYWDRVPAQLRSHSPEDFNFLVEQLLGANRPRAAFAAVLFKLDLIQSDLLIRLLTDIATGTSPEPDSPFPQRYYIEEALTTLNKREDVKRPHLSNLEYLYIQVLTPLPEYGIPNLSQDIADSPQFFMWLLALCFRRKDEGKDPDEWNLPADPETKKYAAERAYLALEHAGVIPGSRKDGTIDIQQLRNWVIDARAMAKEHGRTVVGDNRVGHILSRSDTVADDGIWPIQEIRDVLEENASEEISRGLIIGRYNFCNGRGMRNRSRDGVAWERQLVERYRDHAEQITNKTPFVAQVLRELADMYQYDIDRIQTVIRVQERIDN